MAEIDLLDEDQSNQAHEILIHLNGIRQSLKQNDLVTACYKYQEAEDALTAFDNALCAPERWAKRFTRMIGVYYDRIAVFGMKAKKILDEHDDG